MSIPKNQLRRLLSAKCPDFKFIKEYPSAGVHGIDIVRVKETLGKEREIIAIEVLGIAEEKTQKGTPLSSGQVQKIMTDISKLLLRSKTPVKILVFQRLK
ncbi:MAG: hypothetical protein QXX08_09080 [Candidatus Bathyarchaeia archaeon]